MIFGDLPPYEAFPIGGTNSVRGYSEGGVGSGRNYVAGTAELHWPLIKPVEVLSCAASKGNVCRCGAVERRAEGYRPPCSCGGGAFADVQGTGSVALRAAQCECMCA